jgi:hypothetical protein
MSDEEFQKILILLFMFVSMGGVGLSAAWPDLKQLWQARA